jgi:hypothetical protein
LTPRRSLYLLGAALALPLIVVTAAPGLAQTAGAGDGPRDEPLPVFSRNADGHVVVRATRIAQPIKVDGRLDEEAYRQVETLTEFVQQEPDVGAPITERTEAWVLFDDTHFYVACRCWDTNPGRIVANDMRRDSSNLRQNDNFAVEVDTFHDRRNGFLFYVTPVGGMFDAAITDERNGNTDWNAIWEAKAGRFEGGWVAEIAIPFKSLRYAGARGQTWGIQIRRTIRGKNEHAFISPVSPAWGIAAINHMSVAATLVGLEVPPAARNIEIKPYAISRVTTDLVGTPSRQNEHDPDVGVDVKYGVTKGLTADFTYNTDFAQVEADEAQVNLTRFNLTFPEKREFFLEGQGIFAFGVAGGESGGGGDAPAIFYSRSIGLSGARTVPIIGGGRMTGKAGAWSIGALNIETDDDETTGARQTNFTVLRVRRDILRRGGLGAIYTRRSVSTVAPGANHVVGVDTNLAFSQNVYASGYVARSFTSGRSANALGYRAQFNYNSDRYGLGLDRLVVGENFNPEVGFLRRENFRRNFLLGRFSPRTTENRVVRKFTYEGNFEYITDNRNRLESRELRGQFRLDLHSSDALSLQFQRLYEFVPRPFSLADGIRIPVGGYDFDNLTTSVSLGQQHRVSGSASLEIGGFYDGSKKTSTFRGRVELTPRLGIEPNISLNWIDLPYVPEGKFTTTVVGSRTTFTVTPRMFVAALVQYASSNTSLSANFRFRWEYRPGSELFVVYTEGRDTFPPRGSTLENRGFVVKVNRLFRL